LSARDAPPTIAFHTGDAPQGVSPREHTVPPSILSPAFAPAFALETPVVHGSAALDWVIESQRAPARFLAALESRARDLGVASAKTTEAGADLYHDLVARHIGRGWRALRCHVRAPLSGAGHWEELTFDELHARCTYRAAWWAAQGIGPSSSVCVIFPVGVEFAVSLIAALRLGAVVSWIDPQGPDFVTTRLAALAPEHIATSPFLARQLAPLARRVLPPEALAPLPETCSHTYAPGEVCLQLFSPLHAPGTAVAVTAGAVYAGALRDGLACFALRPGDQLAAPGFHALQHQPAMLFAAWIVGAAYLHIEEADAVGDPALLDLPLRTLGISPRVRDAYLQARRGHRPPWAHIVRNPEEPCDWEAWRAFLEGCDLGELPISNLVADAAAGGALLSSPRRPGKHALAHLQSVMPAPGRPWQLLDFTRSGQPAAADAGVYARLGDGKKPRPLDPQYLVLARRGAEYLYGGTLEPRRCGRLFPADEVLAACARAPFLDGAGVVPVVSGGSASEARFVLVGFTGDEPRARFDAALARRCAELRARIAAALGDDAVPDRVVLFPLYARRADGAIDRAWVQAQYLGGLLFRKAKAPVFHRLTALRRSIRAAAAPPPLHKESPWP
jgi:hypothetical protein